MRQVETAGFDRQRRNRRPRSGLAAVVLCLLLPSPAPAAEAPKAVVLVFARKGADANHAVRVERDLRNMYDHSHGNEPRVPKHHSIERRYDVGYLSKGDVEKARRHFNNAQRSLEKNDPDEANEQLFRAQRFYNKATPYASDHALLRGIFYYYYLAHQMSGTKEKATDAYCAYVGITRNLAGSAGPIEQFEPLADKCGETSVAGTAELKVTANVDGGHVYVDGRAVGVVGKRSPYANPFIPAGPHVVEVRKAGFARWGQLVTLRNGKSESLRARLKKARNRKDEYDPLAELIFEGEDAFSEDYIGDVLFSMSEKFHAAELVIAFLEGGEGEAQLTIFTHGTEDGLRKNSYRFAPGLDAHRPALAKYWKTRKGLTLDPADALPAPDRWAPTLFKVE